MYDVNIYGLLHPTFEILTHFGVIGEGENGMRREVNLISWNGEAPKYDIRCWSEDREHYSRGVTLYPAEMEMFIDRVIEYMKKAMA